jgi:rfaE bifunctional protein nucleotidyltransferase chain/domain
VNERPGMTGEAAPIFRSMVKLSRHLADVGADRVVLANGCFDPLHVGHIRYLHGAKQAGGCLVVAINDDKSSRALKGPGRPMLPVGDRARLISSLEMVDAVLIFSARDVTRILKKLKPSFHAKGTDYTPEDVPERETSAALGIETIIVGDAKSHASSEVVQRIRMGKSGQRGKSD